MSEYEKNKPLFDDEGNEVQESAVNETESVSKEPPAIYGSYFTEYHTPDEMPLQEQELPAVEDFTAEEPVESEDYGESVIIQPEEQEAEQVREETEETETFAEYTHGFEAVNGESVQQDKAEEFNPYAPKQQSPAAENQERPQENLYTYPEQGINPSYNRPVYTNPYNNQGSFNQNGFNQQDCYGNSPDGKDKKGRKAAVAVVAVCVAVALIALISSFFGNTGTTTESTTTTAPNVGYQEQTTGTTAVQNVTVATTQPVTQIINSVWVAEKVRPSVVGVMAYSQGELAGEGSGVLMSEDTAKGLTYIVTCAHVIDDPSCDFAILLLDGSRYDAEVVALDVRTDIGVLKVSKTGLPLAEFGDSSTLKIGEPIYAIGNPGGSEYFGSITNGIIAAIDRSISATYTMTCIQHNAAINPGNSGGALVNSAGQVIGINSSKIAKTDYEGMGFAVPSSIFRTVVDDLIRYGYVPNRPELGIKYATVSDYQLYSIIVSIKGLPKGSVIIAEIPEGSALSGTNAQVGDLIIAVNGKKMDSSDVLLDLIDMGAVGDTLTLTLCRIKDRSYETSTFDVTVRLVEDKGSVTTTTQAQTLPQQDPYGDIEDFFGGFFGW